MSSNISHRRQNTGKKDRFSKRKEKENIKPWGAPRSPPKPELFPSLPSKVIKVFRAVFGG